MSKISYILNRLLQMIPVLIGISFIAFLLLQLTPGDPVKIILGPKAGPEAVNAVKQKYGLDRPIPLQYIIYVKNLLQGDLGHSIVYRGPIASIIWERLEVTLFLIGYGLIFTIIITVVLASSAARNQGKKIDHLVRLFCIAGLGLPSFWLGIMFTLFFSIYLGLFPVSGYGNTFLGHLHHLFLPALTIAILAAPIVIRNFRATLIKEMASDYVNAGRSKGLSERYIFWRHTFRNSLLPVVQLLGVVISWLIGGTVVIETVFAVPGLGQLMVNSIISRDYFMVQGVTLLFAFGVIFTTLIIDVLSMLIDPRV
jgi:ABC-type dipeptide/oligopeptide/nickel transport system permease component